MCIHTGGAVDTYCDTFLQTNIHLIENIKLFCPSGQKDQHKFRDVQYENEDVFLFSIDSVHMSDEILICTREDLKDEAFRKK